LETQGVSPGTLAALALLSLSAQIAIFKIIKHRFDAPEPLAAVARKIHRSPDGRHQRQDYPAASRGDYTGTSLR
jgi:hypothetical protein